MSDIATINKLKQGLTLLDIDADAVHWQSVAVLMANGMCRTEFLTKLVTNDRGWFTTGIGGLSSYTRPSLYLSPKGMPYYVGYGGHYGLYDGLFGARQASMDRAGWLHISNGVVDIHAAMTTHQRRWLDANQPEGNHGWTLKPYDYASERTAPVRYERVERWDVMPTRDPLDFERLFMRIATAGHPAKPADVGEV